MSVDNLRLKLMHKSQMVRKRYRYYEMKDKDMSYSITIPDKIRQQFRATSGWCAKAVDSLADRLQVRGFDNDILDMQQIFDRNNPDMLFDAAILGALISACDFIYISEGPDGYPKLQVIDGANATGSIDPTTGLLKEGYAVLERDDDGTPLIEAYFEPYKTTFFYTKEKLSDEHEHVVPYPLLVPVINRPDATRPFGHSRISKSCMYYQREAKYTMERLAIASELYSFPQKYVLGLSSDTEDFDTMQASISSMLDFRRDEESGTSPTVGQFSQQSMAPYTEQLRTNAAMFAGETGLTLDDLGFASQNPSSAEAIKASHENLRLIARKAQRTFGSGFINAGFLAASLRDKFSFGRYEIVNTKVLWEPIFEPDMAALGLIGDGVQKINTAVPGYFTASNLRDLTGITSMKEEETEQVV